MASADKDLVLGYDIGTSALKAVAVSPEGRIVASGSVSYPLLLPAPGWVEQRPDDWWAAMCTLTPRLIAEAGADPSRVAALAVSAQMCGVVPVDLEGRALANGIIWLDTRSRAIARRLMHGALRINGYGLVRLARWLRLTHGAPNLSGRDPPSKMLWLKENAPDIWERTHKLLDVKDYIVHRCTGRFVTSFDCAHLTWMFDARPNHKQWSADLISRVGIGSALLPDVARASSVVEGLSPDAAAALGLRAGTPVAAGAGDIFAASLAVGTAPGVPHLYVGTGAWLGAVMTTPKVNPLAGIGSLCGADGEDYLLIAAQENGGACVKWALPVLGFPEAAFESFEQCAGEALPSVRAPMFFPWLCGERVPIDDSTVRGGFINLSLDQGRAAMAHAVYEGVALNVRWAMRSFDRLAGTKNRALRFAGGGAMSALWCQIFADVLERPIERIESPALAGACGSARLAGVAAGWYPNLASTSALARVERTFVPEKSRAGVYGERFDAFTAGYRRLRPLYRGGVR